MLNWKRLLLLGTLSLASCGVGQSGGADPLAEALGLENTDGANFQQELDRLHLEAVEDCMITKGYDEFVTYDPAANDPRADIDWESREAAEEWGFGISTTVFSSQIVGPDLKGNDLEVGENTGLAGANEVLVAELSPDERVQYTTDLFGDLDPLSVELAQSSGALSPRLLIGADTLGSTGCLSEAVADSPVGIYAELGDELSEMAAEIDSDPRRQELLEDLNECVTENGAEGTQSELRERTRSLKEKVRETPSAELTEEQKSELAALQEEEIALAVIVFDCTADGGLGDKVNAAKNKIVSEFVDEHRDTIDNYAI